MKVLLKVYDNSKYNEDANKMFEKVYSNVSSWEVLSWKQFKDGLYDDLDENEEYLRIYFDNGETSTYRNSRVDLFKW